MTDISTPDGGDEARRLVRASRFLSRVLRHQPERAGVNLDAQGWVAVADLLAGCARAGLRLDPATLERVVATSDKQRFELSADGRLVRARQGHTVAVDLGLPETPPPAELFHGTHGAVLDAVLTEGLLPMGRHDVHLSPDVRTARRVGSRRGRPVVVVVQAQRMAQDGHAFRVSGNGVWLVPAVPPQYLAPLS